MGIDRLNRISRRVDNMTEELKDAVNAWDGDSEESRAAFRAYDERVFAHSRSSWQMWRDACAWHAEHQKVALKEVRQAIADYHFELDSRQHGGVAQNNAFNAICKAVGMYWREGEELKRRIRRSAGAKS
jgi:uncharacterized protein (DUF2461 family)